MVLNVSAKWITFVRFALYFNRKLMILVSTVERSGLYVNFYGHYAFITSLLRDQGTLYDASSHLLEIRSVYVLI